MAEWGAVCAAPAGRPNTGNGRLGAKDLHGSISPYTSTDIVANNSHRWRRSRHEPVDRRQATTRRVPGLGMVVPNYPEPRRTGRLKNGQVGSRELVRLNERHDKRRRAFGAGMVRHRGEAGHDCQGGSNGHHSPGRVWVKPNGPGPFERKTPGRPVARRKRPAVSRGDPADTPKRLRRGPGRWGV